MSKYRNSDDPGFDLEKLSEPLNQGNVKFRDQFYSRIDYSLARKQLHDGGINNPESIVEQFKNSLDHALGVDFSEAKKNKISNAQSKMLLEKNILDQSQEFFSEDDYLRRLNKYVEEFLNTVADVLSDEEFINLFQITKDDVGGALYDIVDD